MELKQTITFQIEFHYKLHAQRVNLLKECWQTVLLNLFTRPYQKDLQLKIQGGKIEQKNCYFSLSRYVNRVFDFQHIQKATCLIQTSTFENLNQKLFDIFHFFTFS